MHLAERSAEHGEILGVDRHPAAVDLAESGDHAIAGKALIGHAEVGEAVGGQGSQLLEGTLIKQNGQPLARSHLALGVLGLDTRTAATLQGLLAQVAQCRQLIF